jgi:hypothetical protein
MTEKFVNSYELARALKAPAPDDMYVNMLEWLIEEGDEFAKLLNPMLDGYGLDEEDNFFTPPTLLLANRIDLLLNGRWEPKRRFWCKMADALAEKVPNTRNKRHRAVDRATVKFGRHYDLCIKGINDYMEIYYGRRGTECRYQWSPHSKYYEGA